MAIGNEKNSCLSSIEAAYLGYVGMIVQGVAFLVLGIFVFKIRMIMLKLKKDEDENMNLRNQLY